MYEMIIPFGANFELVHQEASDIEMRFFLISRTKSAICPKCQQVSTRRHSRTKRQIKDLPIVQKEVIYHIQLTKWFCETSSCASKVFTEQLTECPAYQRFTIRATDFLRQLAFKMNCVQASNLSRNLKLPVSHDTLLRLIYKTPTPQMTSPFPCD